MNRFIKILIIILAIGVTVMSGACGFFGKAGVPNPWAETDSDGVKAVMGMRFTVPEEATDVSYRYNSTIRLAEVQYNVGAVRYCARIRSCDEYEDISGMYYSWSKDEKINDFQGAEARSMKYNGENETIEVVEAFYPDAKIQCCLTAVSKSESAGNLISMARSVWSDIPVEPAPTAEPTEEPAPTDEPEPTQEPEEDPYAKILEFAQSFIGKNYDEITEILGEPLNDELWEGDRIIAYDEFYLILNEENTAVDAGIPVKPETTEETEGTFEPESTYEPESEATPEC